MSFCACSCGCRILIISGRSLIFSCSIQYSVFSGLSEGAMRGAKALIITDISLVSMQLWVLFVKFPFLFSRKVKASLMLLIVVQWACVFTIYLMFILPIPPRFYGIFELE